VHRNIVQRTRQIVHRWWGWRWRRRRRCSWACRRCGRIGSFLAFGLLSHAFRFCGNWKNGRAPPAFNVSGPRRHSNFRGGSQETKRQRSMNPSGRFDALIDMGNPLKGVVVFPFLSRYKEGRALRAMGPAECLEMSRTAGEHGTKWQWPQTVCNSHRCLFF
jgi:hypothetical protein